MYIHKGIYTEENIGVGLEGIWTVNLDYGILLDLDWKLFRQQFITILTSYFTGAGLGNTWTTNLDYNYYISQDLDFNSLKYLDLQFGFRLLFALLD